MIDKQNAFQRVYLCLSSPQHFYNSNFVITRVFIAVTLTTRLPEKITGLDLLHISVAIQYCPGGQINLRIGKVMHVKPRFLSRLQLEPVDTKSTTWPIVLDALRRCYTEPLNA